MDPRQKRIIIWLSVAVGVLLLAVIIAALGRRSPEEELSVGVVVNETTTTTVMDTTTSTVAETTTSVAETTTSVQDTTTSSEATTSTSTPASEVLTLEGDGLGPVSFGDPAEAVITALTALLGQPDDDSGWVEATSSPFGVCPGDQVRGVQWASLLTLYSDGETAYGPAGVHHFFAYVDSLFQGDETVGLETAEGVGLGDSRQDLEETYGDRVTITEDEVFGVFFQIDVEEPAILWGHLSDTAPDAQIVDIRGGNGCGE